MKPLPPGAMIPDPPGLISIIELAHGYRIDMIAVHDASGEARQLQPVHQPTLDLARRYAAMVSKATGSRIEERLR